MKILFSQELIIVKSGREVSGMEEWVKPSSSKDETTYAPDQCIVCGKKLVPPITRCQNGHGVCFICLHTSNHTCSCGVKLEDELTNNLPPDMKFNCMNRAKGCSERLTLEYLEEHESTCPYNPNGPVSYCQIL
ncbi:hypothetical protein L9F63_024424 [Diploptera punctata]|uniref:Uncharacterized protein n=1 Tax=Diploptera punctata TaxID=6984 RepID=A0AAD7ZF79_DIPPU|nr:hypothetical protein L9F63_024424 [Diploptera punctata]